MIENGREKGLSLALKIKLRPAPKEFITLVGILGLYGIVSDIGGPSISTLSYSRCLAKNLLAKPVRHK